ncbi:MAG: hypothetical protein ABII09_00305 [Planctomycetota bacterium]
MLLHLVDDLGGLIDVRGLAGNEQIVLSRGQPDVEGVTDEAQMGIGRPEQFELFVG